MVIILEGPIIFAEGLTYKQACEALDKIVLRCRENPVLSQYRFYISSLNQKDGEWRLCANNIELSDSFCKDSENFVIEV